MLLRTCPNPKLFVFLKSFINIFSFHILSEINVSEVNYSWRSLLICGWLDVTVSSQYHSGWVYLFEVESLLSVGLSSKNIHVSFIPEDKLNISVWAKIRKILWHRRQWRESFENLLIKTSIFSWNICHSVLSVPRTRSEYQEGTVPKKVLRRQSDFSLAEKRKSTFQLNYLII